VHALARTSMRPLTAFSQTEWADPDPGDCAGHPADPNLRFWIATHWPDRRH